MNRVGKLLALCGMLGGMGAVAQDLPQTDSSKIAPDGTAYVTRVVPLPLTVSAEARAFLAKQGTDAVGPPATIEQQRAFAAKITAPYIAAAKKLYPVTMTDATLAGVPVRVLVPLNAAADKSDCVLMNLHGGAFRTDWNSIVESMPVANLSGIKVVSVLYRMAPEHPFPAAVDDAVAVYKELLKTHAPGKIGIFGSSAGAMLTGEVTAELKKLGLPMPGATGIFSGWGDFSTLGGDSAAMYTLNGLVGHLDPPGAHADRSGLKAYVGSVDLKDPILSPLYSDVSGFPPTLFITSTRDVLLSGTTILHRAYLRAGVDARLVVFEALPHTFWEDVELPESKEASGVMAKFFVEQLRR